jgi:hypothetical protein
MLTRKYLIKKAKENRKLLDQAADDNGLELLAADGYDAAIVGVVNGIGLPAPLVVYDRELVLQVMQVVDGMTEEDAHEHFSFNVEGSYVGENTPVFLTRLKDL